MVCVKAFRVWCELFCRLSGCGVNCVPVCVVGFQDVV